MPLKPTKPKGRPAPSRKLSASRKVARAQRSPAHAEVKPADPLATPEEHAQAAQDLRNWAQAEVDPQAQQRLNQLASLNEAFSRLKPDATAAPETPAV